MAKKNCSENENPTFEQALARLEEIVAALESGDQGLEESISLFEEGTKLSRFCQEKLSAAQGKIEKLVEAANGRLATEEIEISVFEDEAED